MEGGENKNGAVADNNHTDFPFQFMERIIKISDYLLWMKV